MALEKGTTLAGYEITGILGQGGMGVVYEATQVSLNRTVALKVLAPHLSEDVVFQERFRREGQIQAGIDHAHIVTVYEAGETEHGFFIAMRLIRGPNLKDLIVSRVLDPGRTLRILSPIAQALDAAHEAELIHRDIKPQNILVGGRDQAFLADFGLTKASGEKSLTRTGQFVGTFDYISPEQIKGERATRASDVYSLAAVIYESLTGVVPFPKDSEAAVLYAQMVDPPPKVTDERPELPATLDQVIAKGMAKDPAERFESPGQLLLETNRSFNRRMRAAFTPPRPIEAPQETGIRSAEQDVDTRESPAQDLEPSTERAALEAETVLPADPGLTKRSVEPAPAAEPVEEEPAGTAAGASAPPETVAPETPPSAEPPTGARETAPAKTAPSAEPPDLDPTKPVQVDAAEARLGGAGMGAPTVESEEASPAATRRERPARPTPVAPVIAGAAVLLLAMVVGGFLIGRSGGGSDEEATPRAQSSAAVGALELSWPEGWRRVASPPDIPGIEFRQQIALAKMGGPRGDSLIAGLTDATGPSLLPAAFLDRLDEPPPRTDAVKLGDLDVYRYRNLLPRDFDGRLTLYVAPTTKGVATVACTATAADRATFLPACEDVAGSLKLTSGEAFALGADKDYAATLKRTINRLNGARKRHVATLRKAKTPTGQAAAATVLALDYRRAERSLSGLSVSPVVSSAASAAVRRALARTGAAYRRLASAARRERSGAYNDARSDVAAGDAALKRALRRVGAAS